MFSTAARAADWIATPTAYGFLTAGFFICLFLFISYSLDARLKEHRLRTEFVALRDELAGLQQRLEGIDLVVEEKVGGIQGPAPRNGFNLNKRTQALRMQRKGQSPEAIAAALNLTRSEVDLILKVQQMMLSAVTPAADAATAALQAQERH